MNMIIRAITPKRRSFYEVKTDEGVYLINRETFDMAGLKEGSSVSEEALASLMEKSNKDRAKSRALWYLARADYSSKKLCEKLSKDFGKTAAEYAVARMEELNLIDDRRYAERFAEAKLRENYSKKEVLRKLFEKGIPRDMAKEVMGELECSPVDQLCAIIEKKHLKKLKEDDGFRKVFAALARRGFYFGDIRTALKKYTDEFNFDEEIYDD